MNINELASAFEAVLFAGGEPVPTEKICEIFDIDSGTCEEAMLLLRDRLDRTNSGVQLLKLEDSYQLCSRKEYGDFVRTAFDLRRRTPLSQAALEVLSVVAYNQPVTKSYIEQVRGVDCSGVVATLVEKGLIEEKGRLELPGRPLLYGTTNNFLRCFSLKSLTELPTVSDETGNNSIQEEMTEV